MTLALDELGSGPDVVLLHGMPTTPEHMTPLARRLSSRWRTLVVHLPGYGRSTALDPYSVDESHTLVEDALLAHGVREAHMIGFSASAYRAIAHAIRRRVNVLSIYSIGGFADLADEERQGLRDYIPLVLSGQPLEPVLETVMLAEPSRANPAAVADVRAWANATTRENLARELAAWSDVPDLRRPFGELDLPVVARVGTLDTASPRTRSERLVAAAKRARLEDVEGVGHTLLAEDFEGTALSIERLLDG